MNINKNKNFDFKNFRNKNQGTLNTASVYYNILSRMINTNEKNNNINKETQTSTDSTLLINENIKKKLLDEKDVFVISRTSQLQRGIAELLLEKIKEELKLADRSEALSILAVLFQQGGTARSCDGNMNVTLFGKECKLADIRRVLSQNSCRKAERKLARTLANEIREICLLMEIPGNLSLKIQKNNIERTFTTEEKVWLSDFQSDNEKCPAELRKLITETFKKPDDKKKKKGKNK